MSGGAFKDLFPSNDPKARWVLVLCLARNDIVATSERIVAANEDDDGTNLHWARILHAHLFEAALFLRSTSSLSPSKEMVPRLPAERQADCKLLLDSLLKETLEHDRNLTFHYPTIDCEDARHGGPKLVEAMHAARDQQLDIRIKYDENDKPIGYRYRFADLVAAEFAMAKFVRSDEALRAAIQQVQDWAGAFSRFADAVFYAWGQDHGVMFGDPQSP